MATSRHGSDPPERLLKMSTEGLPREGAVLGHVVEIDSSLHPKQHLKQLRQKLAVPSSDLEVVDGQHFCEDELKYRRAWQLRKHRS